MRFADSIHLYLTNNLCDPLPLLIQLKRKLRRMTRPIRCLYQRIVYGFDDSETWSLDWTLAKFMVPRLKRFKKIKRSVPIQFFSDSYLSKNDHNDKDFQKAEAKYHAVLDEMIEGFQLLIDNEEDKKIDRAFKLLAKYHNTLWW